MTISDDNIDFRKVFKRSIYDKKWLRGKVETVKPDDWLFFYGHTPRDGEMEGKYLLSQWWDISFKVDGVFYPTADHWK